MGKGEYSKHLKEQQKEALSQKHHEYYERVNNIIDYANANRDSLVIKGSQERLDSLIAQYKKYCIPVFCISDQSVVKANR